LRRRSTYPIITEAVDIVAFLSRVLMRFRAIVSWAMTVSFLLSVTPDGAAADVTPQTLKSGEILRGRFVQERQLAGFAKPLRTTGTFALVPGRGLIWRALTPFQDTTVITPDGILGQVNGRETMRLPASRVPGLGHLYEVLGGAVSGNTAPLEQTFDVKRSDSPESWRLLLTPLHPDNPAMSQIKSMTVTGHRFVDSVEVDKDGGDIDRLSFLDQTVVAAPPSADETSLLGAIHK
jgi:hypothetical protein